MEAHEYPLFKQHASLIEQELVDLMLPLLARLLIVQRHEALLKLPGSRLLQPLGSLELSPSPPGSKLSHMSLNHQYLIQIALVELMLLPLQDLPQNLLNNDRLLEFDSRVDFLSQLPHFILLLDDIDFLSQLLLDLSARLQASVVLDEAAELPPIELDTPCPAHCLSSLL